MTGTLGLGREGAAKLAHKGDIGGVDVAPKARALLQAGIDFAQSVARLLQLNLVEYVENAGAIKLYESLGFEIFGRELGAIMVDDVLYDDFHMRLDLRR